MAYQSLIYKITFMSVSLTYVAFGDFRNKPQSLQDGTCLVKFKCREDHEFSGCPLDLGGVHWRMLGLGHQADPPFECIPGYKQYLVV